jgi:hypothetical protein
MKTVETLILICLLMLFITSCSEKNNVIIGNLNDNPLLISSSDGIKDIGIFGAYLLEIAPDGKSAELTPMRTSALGESYLVSGLNFFTSNPCPNCLKLHSLGYDAPYLRARFQISHPFKPGSLSEPPSAVNRRDLDVFDLTMVIVPKQITPESYSLGDIYLDACWNQDGFTTELGNVIGTYTACPYFLVIDDSDGGNSTYNKFAMGTQNIVFDTWFQNIGRFDIYLTMGYGFSAKKPQRLTPKYYNPEFNRKSAWKVNVHPPEPGSTWTESDTTTPHDVTVEVFDWQIGSNVNSSLTNTTDVYAASEVEKVSVEIPGMTSAPVDALTPTSGSGKPNDPLIYNVSMANVNGLPAGEYTGLVKVYDERVPPDPITDRDFLIHSATGSSAIELDDITPPELNFKSNDIAVNGNIAYVAGWNEGIHILDISDINNPRLINTVPPRDDGTYPYSCVSLFFSAGYVYVADREGLQIIDVSLPEDAHQAGELDIPGTSQNVFVDGGYAYVTDNVLHIIDIDPPESPVLINTISGLDANDVFVSGDYAYVAGNGFSVLDITPPETASIVDSLSFTSLCMCVYVQGSYAYVGFNPGTLLIVDVSNPASISSVKTVVTPESTGDVFISGNYAYVANNYGGFSIIDINPPASAYVVSTTETYNMADKITVLNDHAFVTGLESGLSIYDVTPSMPVSLITRTGQLGNPQYVCSSSGYAYVTSTVTSCAYNNFSIIDIRSPSNVKQSGCLEVPFAGAFDISGDYAYVSTSDTMQILDINPPESVNLVKSLNLGNGLNDIEVSNGFAYAVNQQGLVIVDIDPPGSESIVKVVPLASDRPGSVCIDGNYAYIAVGEFGIQAVDISDPATAHVVKTINTSEAAYYVCAIGDYAYVASHTEDSAILEIIKVKPFESAYTVKTISLSGGPTQRVPCGLDVKGQAALISHGKNLDLVDINPPSNAHIEQTRQYDRPKGIYIGEVYTLLGAEVAGLRIFTGDFHYNGELINFPIPEYATYQTFTAIIDP